MLEGEVSGDNDEEEDQVGEKGRRCEGIPRGLDIGIINQSIGNLRQMVGGGSNPYGLVGILTPALPGNLYGFLGFHTGYDVQL